jgi:hypothetical protein
VPVCLRPFPFQKSNLKPTLTDRGRKVRVGEGAALLRGGAGAAGVEVMTSMLMNAATTA